MNQFSSLFINLINFSSIFIFLGSIFVKKILPSYRQKMLENQKLKTQNFDFIHDLIEEKNQLLILHNKQENLIGGLKEKITIWNKAIVSEKHKTMDEFQKIKAAQTKKQIRLQENFFNKNIHQKALEQSCIETKKHIEDLFTDNDKKVAYLTKIINTILKKESLYE